MFLFLSGPVPFWVVKCCSHACQQAPCGLSIPAVADFDLARSAATDLLQGTQQDQEVSSLESKCEMGLTSTEAMFAIVMQMAAV